MNCPFDRKRPIWPLLANFALFGLLVLVTVSCGGASGEQSAEGPAKDEPQAGSDEEQAAADLEHPTLGDENAPVVLTEYADYQ